MAFEAETLSGPTGGSYLPCRRIKNCWVTIVDNSKFLKLYKKSVELLLSSLRPRWVLREVHTFLAGELKSASDFSIHFRQFLLSS
jgi:hypothetical protein